MFSATRDWDAGTYHRVSIPHQEWADSIFARLPLSGDETVLDAGCGSGKVTAKLIERLPRGRVIAVDGSEAMLAKARESLRPQDEAIHADLTTLRLAEPVDAVFSSAVFHWVKDQDALFTSLLAAMRPGAQLASQCGGAGNVADFLAHTEEVAAREPYAAHLASYEQDWFFADAEETAARLQRLGFERVRCWLEPWSVAPPEPVDFVRTVVLGPHLDLLPDELGDAFVADVLALEPQPVTLHYVRLNVEAFAPA